MSFDPVGDYARDVVAGRIVAGPHVRATCRRHLKDLETGHERGLWFDYAKALHVIKFFETQLFLSEGQFEGIPFNLHISQKFKIGSIFGWMMKNEKGDTVRRFRRAYVEEGKGNGKSPLAGGIGIYGLIADGEMGSQIYSAGATRDQSDILFQDAVKMVRKMDMDEDDPIIEFAGNNKIYQMYSVRKGGSFFKPLARTAGKTGSGPRPHFALCDEVHEHPNREVLDLLERGFKFRRQPLLLMITNSGSDRNSICFEEHEHAIKVAHGDVEDDTTFSYVCALDPGDKPLDDPSCWIKANPCLGTIISYEYLAGIVKQARNFPGKLNGILRLHFCVWTDADTAWCTREAWEAIEDRTLDRVDFHGRRAWIGLDLASRKDIAAAALVIEDGEVDGPEGEMLPCFVAFVHGYTPKDTLTERALADKAPYDVWVDQGFLTATPGPVIRFSHIIHDTVEDQENFDLQAVAYDRHLIVRFEDDMADAGADFPLVEHPQGWNKRKTDELETEPKHPLWMPHSVDLFEQLILERRLRVHINPALRSAVAGATFLTSPAGLKRFDKSKATTRIDLCVALAMAIGAAYTDVEQGGTIHEDRGRAALEAERIKRHAAKDEPKGVLQRTPDQRR